MEYKISEGQLCRMFNKLSLAEQLTALDYFVRIISDEIGFLERTLDDKTSTLTLVNKLANKGKTTKTTLEGIKNILSEDKEDKNAQTKQKTFA